MSILFVKKILARKNIQALRVDEINHNNNIDLKIIELINECNFCISDLTYARPSVYYEAGYVAGQKKNVIYIVRHDHFKVKSNDINGNLRVHFDLQMKNIIDWNVNDKNEKFIKKLEERIDLIIQPLILEANIDLLKKENRRNYSLMSIEQRKENIRLEILNYLKREGLTISEQDTSIKRLNNKRQVEYFFDNNNVFRVLLTESATLKYLKSPFLRFSVGVAQRSNDFYYHYIIISLRSIPKTRIEDAFPAAQKISIEGIIKIEENEIAEYMHFISGEKSINEIRRFRLLGGAKNQDPTRRSERELTF